MRKKKKQSTGFMHTDARLAADFPTANSPEFIPIPETDLKEFDPENSKDVFDFIPEIKGDKFS